jgi:hypothetical protein
METPTPKVETQSSENPQKTPSPPPIPDSETPKSQIDEQLKSPAIKAEQVLDTEAELAKLESEFGKVDRDYSTEEVGDWEFDELERELRAGDSATSK